MFSYQVKVEDTKCRARQRWGNVEKYVFKMPPRWMERRLGDQQKLAKSLGLSVEELIVAQQSPHFFLVASIVIKNNLAWADVYPTIVRLGAIGEINGEILITDPDLWFCEGAEDSWRDE